MSVPSVTIAGMDTATDEDRWVVPTRWWGTALPIRGLGPAPRERVSADAAARAARTYDDATEFVATALDNPDSDPALVTHGRAALTGAPNVLGHAVIATLVCATSDFPATGDLLDLWVTRFGVAGAAQLVASMTQLGVARSTPSDGRPAYEGPPAIGAVAPDLIQGPIVTTRCRGGQVEGFRPWDPHIRLRRLVAALPDDDYTALVEAFAQLRGRSRAVDAMIVYLLPSRQEWVDAAIAAIPPRNHWGDLDGYRQALFGSITTMDQLDALIDASIDAGHDRGHLIWMIGTGKAVLPSLVCHLGPACAPLLAEIADGNVSAANRYKIYDYLSHMPTDKAFALLLDRLGRKNVERSVLAAADRFPRRALRLFTERGLQRLRDDHVRTHPELSPETSDTVVPADVPAGRVPALLASPPWVGYRRPKPVTVSVESSPTPVCTRWRAGERQRWTQTAPRYPIGPGSGWQAHIEADLRHPRGLRVETFSQAPVEMIRPYLHGAQPGFVWRALPDLQRILGRFDTEAIGYVLAAVRSKPVGHIEALLPVEGGEIAALMATWCTRRTTRAAAQQWLERHAPTAAHDLIPAAVGTPGPPRAAAETALLYLHSIGWGDTVRSAAAGYGREAAEVIDTLLTTDPVLRLPARMPALPSWLRPELLPALHARGGDDALPLDAVTNLCLMAALCQPDVVYAGIEQVIGELDAPTLAQWARAVFEQWRHAGYPAAQGWILTLQALVGDDDTVTMLSPLIRSWPGQSAHTRAVAGLDALAQIGTDTALLHLHAISEKLKFPALKTAAQDKIEQIAVDLGLTTDQLGDRLVPTFDLDTPDALHLNYGPRSFTFDFDEHLRPILYDATGRVRKTLPKPAAGDDPDLAPTAYARFTALRKNLKPVAGDQIARLEQAMVTRPRWTTIEFTDFFVDHPLLIHLVRRLVWGIYTPTGEQLRAAFRISDDDTFLDLDDIVVSAGDEEVIGLVHPCELGATLTAWRTRFEIAQPFEQLHRTVHQATGPDRTDLRLTRFERLHVPAAALIGLERNGWVREEPADAGMQISTSRTLPSGTVTVSFSPGISVGAPTMFPDQYLVDISVNPRPLGHWHRVDTSETLRDLTDLASTHTPATT